MQAESGYCHNNQAVSSMDESCGYHATGYPQQIRERFQLVISHYAVKITSNEYQVNSDCTCNHFKLGYYHCFCLLDYLNYSTFLDFVKIFLLFLDINNCMKFKDFIKEEWADSIYSYRTGFTAEVFKNPTVSEYKSLANQDDEIRGIITPNGDLYLWPSTTAEHYYVAQHFKLPKSQKNIPIYIFSLKGWVEISYYTIDDISNWDRYKEARELASKITNNKYLRRLLGTVVLRN